MDRTIAQPRAKAPASSIASNPSVPSSDTDLAPSSVRLAVQGAGVVLLALALANCSSTTQKVGSAKIDPKYGVAPSPRVVADGQPVPKGGGRDHTGKPYQVAGKTYVPRLNEKYTTVGTASWYGADFHGRLTANGEVFDRMSIAAAHPTLPLPSYVRVTNLNNNRSMVVRVNDRGPFHGGRVIDVSRRVADALDFRRAGTAQVKVEYVGRASLRGSDDRKLMATLQIDGRPANGSAPAVPVVPVTAPVMVASAEPAQLPTPPVAAAPTLAYSTPAPTSAQASTTVQRLASSAIPMPVPRPDFLQHGPAANLAAVTPAPAAAPAQTFRAEVATIDDLLDLNTIPNAGVPVAVAVPPAGKPVVAGLFYAAQQTGARFETPAPLTLVKQGQFVPFKRTETN